MFLSLHQIMAYLFMGGFLGALLVFFIGAIYKNQNLKQKGIYVFLGSYLVFLLLYFNGLTIKQDVIQVVPESTVQSVEKHHKMAKFIFTTNTLMALACLFILFKYRQEVLPDWFIPNFILLYLTVFVFLVRALLTGWWISLSG